MRAMREDVGPGHTGEQGLYLLVMKLISCLDGSLAGHGGQDVIYDETLTFLFITIAQTGQKIKKKFTRIAVTHHRRDT